MRNVILISAKAEHGKNTFAQMLKEELELCNQRVAILSFAKYIKMYLKDYYGWDGVNKDDYWRTKLQIMGTEKIRQKMNMPNFHVGRVCEDMQVMEDDFDFFIIPDARFPNEIYYTKALFPDKARDVRIERLRFEGKLTSEQKKHLSETSLDDFKFETEIFNTTLENLRIEAKYYIENVLKVGGVWVN